jgi:5-deoxy-5-amino-3-dehydroquinate synthase
VRSVPVRLPDGRCYDVLVGSGVVNELADVVKRVAPKAKRAAVITQANIPWPGLQDPDLGGLEVRRFEIGRGEEHKTLATVETLCSQFAAWGLTRNDLVIAVGGGMVTDVGGFAASVYHRGVAVIYVSTTLLGMIDAAIGGKTGVNLPEGKNLVGTFWQPSAVLCDIDALSTLSPREHRSGLGEMAKYHFLGLDVGDGEALDELRMEYRVARCVEIKADVVASDEREGGRRAILNYGHTLAHALEIAHEFSVTHGEAVGIGLLYAAELSAALGRIDRARVAEHRRVVAGYDLPMTLPPGSDAEQLIALMGRDKKALDGLTFVLDGPNGVETVTGVAPDLLRDVMESIR